jgi:hypothetical protein
MRSRARLKDTRLVSIAIGKCETRRLRSEKRQKSAPGGTAGAQQQNIATGDGVAEIRLNVVEEADPVEILGNDAAVLEFEAVCRARHRRVRALLIREGERLQLDRRSPLHEEPVFALELERIHATWSIIVWPSCRKLPHSATELNRAAASGPTDGA